MVSEALGIELFADVVVISVAVPSVKLIPIADHAEVSQPDIIDIQSAKNLVFLAVPVF